MAELDDEIPALPDLDRDLGPRRGPSGSPAAPGAAPGAPAAPAAIASLPSPPSALDDFDLDEPPPGLLEIDAVLPPKSTAAPSLGPASAGGGVLSAAPASGSMAVPSTAPLSGRGAAGASASGPGASAAPRSAGGAAAPIVAPELAAPEVDLAEVVALADYGPVPRSWYETPFYALRVWQRRRQIARELGAQRLLLLELQQGHVMRLARLAEDLRRSGRAGLAAQALLAPLDRFDEIAGARRVEVQEASRQLEGEVAALDRQIAELEAQAAASAAALREAEAAFRKVDEERARVEARVKRVDIELRAAHEAARVAAGPGAKFAPPEHAARIKDLEAEREVRVEETRPVLAAWTAASEAYRARQAADREVRRRLAGVRDQRLEVERLGAARVAERSAGVKEAEREKANAYADAAREILVKAPDDIPAEQRAAVAESEGLVRARAREVEKHARALEAADPQAVRTGLIVLGVAGGLCFLLFAAALRAILI